MHPEAAGANDKWTTAFGAAAVLLFAIPVIAVSGLLAGFQIFSMLAANWEKVLVEISAAYGFTALTAFRSHNRLAGTLTSMSCAAVLINIAPVRVEWWLSVQSLVMVWIIWVNPLASAVACGSSIKRKQPLLAASTGLAFVFQLLWIGLGLTITT